MVKITTDVEHRFSSHFKFVKKTADVRHILVEYSFLFIFLSLESNSDLDYGATRNIIFLSDIGSRSKSGSSDDRTSKYSFKNRYVLI